MSLDVHLHGERIGTLFHAGEGDYRFAYAPETVSRVGLGTALLSNSLPVREEPFDAAVSRAYVEGLLPEGARRRRIAQELGIGHRDGFDLLARLGGDCAGAAVFVSMDEDLGGAESVRWLTEEELGELVAAAPGLMHARSEPPLRFSLSGDNHKLALVREEDGDRWALPTPDVASTHVVKPETGVQPDLVFNEMFCTEVARRTGLPAVETDVATLAGVPCLVSRRFDRRRSGLQAMRLHQEDFCQALGLPSRDEAEDDGPGFGEACGLLRSVGCPEDTRYLLGAAICNYILGNGDAHGENFALLFDGDGQRLAPLHDIASTLVYDAPIHSGMVIAEEYDAEHPSLIELALVCDESGYDFDAFRRLTGVIAEAVGACLEEVAGRARDEGWHAPVIDEIVALGAERAFGLRAEVE